MRTTRPASACRQEYVVELDNTPVGTLMLVVLFASLPLSNTIVLSGLRWMTQWLDAWLSPSGSLNAPACNVSVKSWFVAPSGGDRLVGACGGLFGADGVVKEVGAGAGLRAPSSSV